MNGKVAMVIKIAVPKIITTFLIGSQIADAWLFQAHSTAPNEQKRSTTPLIRCVSPGWAEEAHER